MKIIYDRMEDMAATTKRHPSRTRHRTAVVRDGKILGGEIEFAVDGGAYVTLSPVVLSRGTIHAGGAYYWPNVRIKAKAIATNTPPHGAFRGFGAPQSLFALERHMDRIAQVVGFSPVEIRKRNFLEAGTGDNHGTGHPRARSIWKNFSIARWNSPTIKPRRQRFAKENESGTIRKGMGIAAFLHGAGFTGSGERYLGSVVGVEGCADGKVRVLVSSTEFGQGTKTVLCQIAAEALGLPYENVEIAQAGYERSTEQRPHRSFANRHGGGKTGAIGGVRNQTDADGQRPSRRFVFSRRISRGVPEPGCGPRLIHFMGTLRSASRRFLGRR